MKYMREFIFEKPMMDKLVFLILLNMDVSKNMGKTPNHPICS